MARKQPDSKTIVMFEPDLTETTTIARAMDIRDGGFVPIVFGFRRARYNRSHVAAWREIDLGQTRDGQYGKRIKALARAIPVILRNRRNLDAGCAFLARNLDQLCLALLARALFNRRAILAYEVVDIQPTFTAGGLRGAAIRLIERACLRRIDLLIVSSPAFRHCYFQAVQRYRGDWLLLENKLRMSPAVLERALQQRLMLDASRAARRPWTIGYFGLIRGQATIELMLRLAAALPDTVEIRFRGVITTVDEGWFRSAISRLPNIRYEGEYSNPEDLATLYGEVDFAWAIDLEDIPHNSRWLLPCRFYEAGFFGVPCLAVRGFEIGQLIDQMGVGWTFDRPLAQSLIRFFAELTPGSYEEKRRRLVVCPVETFVAQNDHGELCRRLEQLLDPRRSARALPTVSPSSAASDKVAAEPLEID